MTHRVNIIDVSSVVAVTEPALRNVHHGARDRTDPSWAHLEV